MDIQYGALSKVEEIKASDSGWEVTGYASTFGNTDHGGDVVMRGAFDDTLASGRPVRFLFGHDTHMVLGTPKSLRADDRGLLGTFKISKTQLGEDTHTLLKDQAIDSFSIGYVVEEAEFDDTGVRLLKKIDLLEVSLVAIPMNDRAVVTRVKADLPFDQLLGRSAEHLRLAVAEAEALRTRRVSEERELTERHLAAIKALLDEVKASGERLEALQPTPAVTEALGDDPELRELFLKNRRRRLERLGIRMEAA